MKIISGGQTGVDQAALDVAIALRLDYGGYIPRDRRTENGPLSLKYDRMIELDTIGYPARTRKNVLVSDATLLLTLGKMSGGTALTRQIAAWAGKPYLHVNLKSASRRKAVELVRNWLARAQPEVLNIAGPRESNSPGIYHTAYQILERVWSINPGEKQE